MEAGFDAHSLGFITHPHPTLFKTVSYTVQMVIRSITELPMRKTAH